MSSRNDTKLDPTLLPCEAILPRVRGPLDSFRPASAIDTTFMFSGALAGAPLSLLAADAALAAGRT
jgi:hypothetical protein